MGRKENADARYVARRDSGAGSPRLDFITSYVNGLLDSPRLRQAREAFVPPRIGGDSNEGRPVSLATVLEKSRRAIILGDVGAGKTSLLLAVAGDYAARWAGFDDEARLRLCNERRIPIYVSLRPASTITIQQQVGAAITIALSQQEGSRLAPPWSATPSPMVGSPREEPATGAVEGDGVTGSDDGREIGSSEVSELLRREKVLLLFDDFSRIPSEHQLETLRAIVQFVTADYPHQSFVIALRSHDFAVLQAWFRDVPVLNIHPLGDGEITAMVSRLLEDEAASALFQRLSANGDWWELGRSPLVLATACSVIASAPSGGDIAFLERLTTALIDRGGSVEEPEAELAEPVFNRAAYASALARLAFATLRGGSGSLDRNACEQILATTLAGEPDGGRRDAPKRVDITPGLGQPPSPALAQRAARMCRELIDTGIIQPTSEGRAVAFRHSLILQFFGAQAMSNGDPMEQIVEALDVDSPGLTLPSPRGLDGDREKSIVFYISQSADKRGAITSIFGNGSEYARVLLAARCLVSLGESSYRELVGIRPDNVALHEQFGRAFRQLKSYRQARQAIEDAVRLDPNRASAHQEIADILAENGHFAEAAGEYQAALRIGGDEIGYHLAMADVSARRGLWDESRAHLAHADEALAQGEAELRHRRGHLHEREEDTDAALEEFKSALTNTETSHLWVHVGSLHRRRGDLAEAETALRRAIACQFGDPDAHREMGAVLEERGDVAKALEEYRVAANLHRDAATCVALGRAYRKLERFAQAEAELRRAAGLNPSDAEATAELGLVYEKRGKHQEALRCYRQSTRIAPDVAEYRKRLGSLLKALGDLPEAENELASAVKLAPAVAEYRERLGEVLKSYGRHREALEQYQIAARLCPDDPAYLLQIGALRSRLGNRDAAIQALNDTLRLCSSGQPQAHQEAISAVVAAGAHDELGLLDESAGQWQDALQHYRAAAALAPLVKSHPLREALLLKKMGQVDEAIEALRRAASLDPRDAEIHAEMGAIGESVGDLGVALAEYGAASKIDPIAATYVASLARVLRRLSRIEEAHQVLGAALERGLDSAGLRREMAAVCGARNENDAALLHSQSAIAAEPESPWSHISLAQSLLALGRRDDALRELKTALALDPSIAEAYYRLAQLHALADSLEEAAACAIQAANLAPDGDDYAYLAGELCAQSDRIDDAIDHFVRATDSPRAHAEWHARLGELLELRGDLEKALDAYRRAADEAESAAAAPDSEPAARRAARYILCAANVLGALERHPEAAETLLRAITLDPTLADAHAALGHALLRVRQPTTARDRFVRACELSPQSAKYWAGLASAYSILDNLAESASAYQRAVVLEPENGRWHNGAGNILRRLARWEDANASLLKAADLAPEVAEYARDAALAQARLGNYQGADKFYRQALSLEDNDLWSQELAGILAILDEPEAALRERRAACSRVSSDWLRHRQLGLLCQRLTLEGESLEALEAARALASDRVDNTTRYALGMVRATAGQLEESLEQLDEVARSAPDSAAAHLAIGVVHRRKLSEINGIISSSDDYRLALESFTRALVLDPEFARAYSELGQLLEMSGDLSTAMDNHLKAVALQPRSSTCRCRAASLFVKMKRLDEAQALVQEGMQNTDSVAPLLNQLGFICEARGHAAKGQDIEDREASEHFRRALEAFSSAISLASWNAVYHFNAGRMCLLLKDLRAAQRLFEEAIRFDPKTPTWRRHLALLYEEKGLWQSAVDEYGRVLQLQPDDADSMLGIGRSLAQGGRLDEAATQLQRALTVEPSAAIYDQFAVVRRLQGQLREALRFSQQALKREPGNHAYQLNLALTQKALGQVQKASAEIRRIASDAPNLAQARYHLAVHLEENGELREAGREYLQARNLAPERALYARAAARVHRLLGENDEAQKVVAEVLALSPRDCEAIIEMARIEQARGHFDAAFRSYRRAIAIQDRPEFHAELAAAMRQRGLLADALVEIRAAIAAEPRHPKWQSEFGLILEDQGNIDDAIALYREALRLDPDGAEYHRNLGVALKKQGKFDEAIAELQRALDLKPDYVDAYRHLTAASASQLLRRTLKNGG